jgi:hypothetical protein
MPWFSFALPRGRGRGSTTPAAAGVIGTLCCLVFVGLLLLGLTAGQAGAGGNEPLDLRYRFSWAGVPIAVFGLRHVTNAGIYQTELEIETTGLADQLFRYRSTARATGAYEALGGFSASRFRSAYTSSDKSRRILIRFDRQTGDVIELELTRRGKPERSKVPEKLQKGVVDPLTALVQLRHELAKGRLDGHTAAIFDGRRRFNLEARVTGRGYAEIAGRKNQPVIDLELGIVWIAGSNQDDIDEAEAGENRLRLKLLVSDDERLIPLRMTTMDSLLTATVEILPECLRPEGCPLVSG